MKQPTYHEADDFEVTMQKMGTALRQDHWRQKESYSPEERRRKTLVTGGQAATLRNVSTYMQHLNNDD